LVFADQSSSWTVAEENAFTALLNQKTSVLPVVASPPLAQKLPKSVSHVNAYIMDFFGSAWPQCLADQILSMMWLQRRTPKVFISYKRTDSGPIADQLYNRFNHLGYETFFDEASVPRGVDFQRELKWWLNDADLLIVLASPRFPRSNWCMEEVSFCQQRFIGVAVVQWPEAIYASENRIPFPEVNAITKPPDILRRAQSEQIVTLLPEEFDGAPDALPQLQLTTEGVSKVMTLCATQRTVGIQQRVNNLIPLARRLLPGASPVGGGSSPADLRYTEGGVKTFVRVLPFRPMPENIFQACIDGAAHGQVAGCFYAENDPHDPRAQALRWLANAKRKPQTSLSDGWLWASVGAALL
jgi:hypothetical protein